MPQSRRFSAHQRNAHSPWLLSVIADISAVCTIFSERHRQRQALRRLDDHLLRDIGLTTEEARQEAGRPFWR